jgi:hypothetical protein
MRDAFTEVVRTMPGPFTVIHGGQKGFDRWTGEWYGADYIADVLARQMGADVEPYPVPKEAWRRLGKAAGPIRNKVMVDAGADICLAFPLGESRGTRGCMELADAAGIPIRNWGDES